MIKPFKQNDIPQVVAIHRSELHGLLTELGERFLTNFYKVSLTIPEIFTLVYKENGEVLGFATGATNVKELYKKVIFQNPIAFATSFLSYFITHPLKSARLVKTLAYPGFSDDIPEILTIAVKKDQQRRGIGGKLFAAAAKNFQKKGFLKFRVSTYERLSANEFYKKIGCRFEKSFEFLGEKMNYYSFRLA